MKAYDEIIDFIAAGANPDRVMKYHPSESTQERVADLIYKEKNSELTQEERSELDHYMELEHIMRKYILKCIISGMQMEILKESLKKIWKQMSKEHY